MTGTLLLLVFVAQAPPTLLWQQCTEASVERTFFVDAAQFHLSVLRGIASSQATYVPSEDRRGGKDCGILSATTRITRFVTDLRFRDISDSGFRPISDYEAVRRIGELESQLTFDLAEIVQVGEAEVVRLRKRGSPPVKHVFGNVDPLLLTSEEFAANIIWISIGEGWSIQRFSSRGQTLLVHAVFEGKMSVPGASKLYKHVQEQFKDRRIRLVLSDTPWFPETGARRPFYNPFVPWSVQSELDFRAGMRFACGESFACAQYEYRQKAR